MPNFLSRLFPSIFENQIIELADDSTRNIKRLFMHIYKEMKFYCFKLLKVQEQINTKVIVEGPLNS